MRTVRVREPLTGDGAGELALVLHTHMPYVEGFGTWPFGEEWLWEAIATSYLPLLDVLAGPGGDRVTLSLTPVLCDQLALDEAIRRCVRFLEEVRPETHARDARELRLGGREALAAEIERSAADYARAARRLRRLGDGGLLAMLGRHASWTSSATHAILPLLATDAGIALQVRTGVASHRARFGDWKGGFWLPECAYAPWLAPRLRDAGVRAACVELTAVYGLGDARHLRPLEAEDGLVLWPLDRATMALVWSEGGYPSAPEYRDYHAVTTHRHHPWRNDGAPYDHGAALARARADAHDFVGRARARLAVGGVCVCALDTELLGHWWYEGVAWLGEVLREAGEQGLALTTLDDALARATPVPAALPPAPTSWGEGGDLRTWSGPRVAELAWRARRAELAVIAADGGPAGRAPERALRELLALQSSDWPFLEHRGIAGDYGRRRAERHAAAVVEAPSGPALRGLAPRLAR